MVWSLRASGILRSPKEPQLVHPTSCAPGEGEGAHPPTQAGLPLAVSRDCRGN